MNNPFTSKLVLGDYPNYIIFSQVLFNKAVVGKYPAKFPTEPIRQAITDMEGPDNRNRYINLDDAQFFCEKFRGIDYWVGVTDIYRDPNRVFYPGGYAYISTRYDHIMEDGSKCIIMPRCTFDTPENSIRSIHCLIEVAKYINNGNCYFGEEIMYIYIAANYLYRALGINILSDENFDEVFKEDKEHRCNGGNEFNEFKKFIDIDAKYVKVLNNDDMNFAKVIGTRDRFNLFNEINRTSIEEMLNKAAVEDFSAKTNTSFDTKKDEEFIKILKSLGDNFSNTIKPSTFAEIYADIINGKEPSKTPMVIISIFYDILPDLANYPFNEYAAIYPFDEYATENIEETIKPYNAIRYGLGKISAYLKNTLSENDFQWYAAFEDVYAMMTYLTITLESNEYEYICKLIQEIAGCTILPGYNKINIIKDFFDLAQNYYESDQFTHSVMHNSWSSSIHSIAIEYEQKIIDYVSPNSDSNSIESSEDNGDAEE